jgi:hypothetical protein
MKPSGPKINAVVLPALLCLFAANPVAGQESDSLTQEVLAHPDFTWRSITEDSVRIYFQPETFSERHRIMLLRSAKAAISQGNEFLGFPAYGRTLNVFYVDDRQQMEVLVGRPVTGYSDWTGSGIFVVCNAEWRSFDTHEIAHVLSIGSWGWPTESSHWMIEGLPIAIDRWCQKFDVDALSCSLVQAGIWPGLEDFLSEYAELGEVRAGVLAASFIRYVRAELGPEAVRSLWVEGPDGFSASWEMDLERFEAGWLEYLRQVTCRTGETDWETLDEEGCG